MNRDTLEQDPCNTCGYEEGSIYCKEHCPHEAKIEKTSSGDAISRKITTAFLSGLISNETERKKALEYINELPLVNPTKTGWIPVGERLPEDGQWVMVTFGGKIAYCHAQDNEGTLKVITFSKVDEIFLYPEPEWGDGYAAWMPLPTPYEPQESEEV